MFGARMPAQFGQARAGNYFLENSLVKRSRTASAHLTCAYGNRLGSATISAPWRVAWRYDRATNLYIDPAPSYRAAAKEDRQIHCVVAIVSSVTFDRSSRLCDVTHVVLYRGFPTMVSHRPLQRASSG